MPTPLEKTFLAEAISDLDDGQLRKVLRAVGDKAFETVAKEVLSIKGEARKVAPYPPGPEVERSEALYTWAIQSGGSCSTGRAAT
jgi:hypothetical protein